MAQLIRQVDRRGIMAVTSRARRGLGVREHLRSLSQEGGRSGLTQTIVYAHNSSKRDNVRPAGKSRPERLDTNIRTCAKWPDGSPGRSVRAGRPARVDTPIPLCSNWSEQISGTVEEAAPEGVAALAVIISRGGK